MKTEDMIIKKIIDSLRADKNLGPNIKIQAIKIPINRPRQQEDEEEYGHRGSYEDEEDEGLDFSSFSNDEEDM